MARGHAGAWLMIQIMIKQTSFVTGMHEIWIYIRLWFDFNCKYHVQNLSYIGAGFLTKRGRTWSLQTPTKTKQPIPKSKNCTEAPRKLVYATARDTSSTARRKTKVLESELDLTGRHQLCLQAVARLRALTSAQTRWLQPRRHLSRIAT